MKPAPNATMLAADEVAVQAFIHERFASMFLGQSRRAQLGLFVAASLVAVIWFSRTRSFEAVAWMAAVAAITGLRYVYTSRFVLGFGSRRTTFGIVVVLLLNGVLMAVPILAFGSLSELERAAVAIILLGSATASVATTSGYRSVFLAFAAPMLLPLAFSWVLIPHEGAPTLAPYGLAFVILIFLFFLVSIGRQAHGVFEEASRFRYGGEQLNRDLQKAFERASEANRAKTHFLAAASHDLRQPIHSMNVLVAALTLRELDPRSREIVTLLDSVNQTLAKQLDSLLDISKLDAGTVKPELVVQQLDHIARAHHSALAPLARERGLSLVLRIDAEISVLTDATLFGRVLGNLTDNALKFTRRGGEVVIGVHREGSLAVLTVADNGIGIAAEEHERVFAEFYQVGNIERDRTRGLGLGLSIVRRLCSLLNAELALESTPGAGTRVSVRLSEVAAHAFVASSGIKLSLVQGLAVLVVDDEQFVRESMRLLLTELGCLVHLAESTEQAQSIAQASNIDVILSDYRLRDGDSGLLAMRAVQAIHPNARAALVTGDIAPDRIQDAQAAGVPLLHKPVTLGNLLSVLQPAGNGAVAMAGAQA